MKAFQDTDRVKNGIREAITLLCKSGLNFQSEMSIDGLLGITLDQNEVFLISIQEVIKNTADYYVGQSVTAQPEDHGQNYFDAQENSQAASEKRSVHQTMSKRSKRKRLLANTYRPLVDVSPSRSSSVDTDDSMGLYYNDGLAQQKRHHLSYETGNAQDDGNSNNEPLSLVVRKSPCDSKIEETGECHSDARLAEVSVFPTDLRVQQSAETPDNGILNNSHSRQNSIKETPIADDHSEDIQTQQGNKCDNRPTLKPKANSRKSKTKPKRIIPMERNKVDDIDDNRSVSSPSGTHSPPPANSQRSTPDGTQDTNVTLALKTAVKVENTDSAEAYSNQTLESNSASFMNVYESGVPVTSQAALSMCKKDGLDVKDKLFDNVIPVAHDSPWGTIFDPDSHAKWLQSIAAYVQGPVNSAAIVPPLAHQCMPFVGSALPNPKLSLPSATKPQVPSLSRVKESSPVSSKPSSSFVNTPIKVPVAVPKLVHSRSMHMCSNCGTQKTTTWRRGDDGTPLCNACGLYLKLHKPVSSGSGQNSLRKVRHQLCSNCNTSVTTMWRRDCDGKPVCNACGLYFKLHKVNRPLTMVKSEIHSRRRKHKYGQFGGKLEPSSPGSVNAGNVSLPYPVSSSQQSPPALLSQTLPLSYPESPGIGAGKDYGEANQSIGSISSSPEPSGESEKSTLNNKQHPSADFQDSRTRYEHSSDGQESAEEDVSESPTTEQSLNRNHHESGAGDTVTHALTSERGNGIE